MSEIFLSDFCFRNKVMRKSVFKFFFLCRNRHLPSLSKFYYKLVFLMLFKSIWNFYRKSNIVWNLFMWNNANASNVLRLLITRLIFGFPYVLSVEWLNYFHSIEVFVLFAMRFRFIFDYLKQHKLEMKEVFALVS